MMQSGPSANALGDGSPNEATPLTAESGCALSKKLFTGVLGGTVITLSVSLINFNKWLMHPGRFPHAIPLVMTHMVICTMLALALLILKPSLFPALTDQCSKTEVDTLFYLKGCCPVAVVTAFALILGNMTYSYLGVAFMQMIKESNLIWVYLLSIITAMERLTMLKSQVVCAAIVGMSLTISGEMHFSLIGFVLQLLAVFGDACRVILQGLLLQGRKLDAMSYILITSPMCFVVVSITMFASMSTPNVGQDLLLPGLQEVIDWAPWLVANACLAFCLNISIAVLIKHTGPMDYIMCQVLKDVVAVTVGCGVVGETVSLKQGAGFSLQVLCVFTWSWMKGDPERFEAGIFAAFCGHSSRTKKLSIV